MAYLNLDLDYFDHPKTRRLVGLLGKGAEVLPLRLWCYCGKFHFESGELAGYSAQAIESICGWWGKEGECIDAMVKVGMLEAMPGALRVHEWENHQGHIKMLRNRARVAAAARWKAFDPENDAKSNAQAHAQALPEQSPIPFHSIPVQSGSTSQKHLTVEHLVSRARQAIECSAVQCFFKEGSMPETEADFITLMEGIDPEGMTNWGGLWRKRWRATPKLCLRVLAEYRETRKEKEINNTGGYLGDLFKRWSKAK